jgi:hypothetical protein
VSWHSLPLHYYTTILYTPLYTTTINHNHTYHYILKYTTLLQTTHPHTMSSPQPTIQYVYIPNQPHMQRNIFSFIPSSSFTLRCATLHPTADGISKYAQDTTKHGMNERNLILVAPIVEPPGLSKGSQPSGGTGVESRIWSSQGRTGTRRTCLPTRLGM